MTITKTLEIKGAFNVLGKSATRELSQYVVAEVKNENKKK